MKLAVIDHSGYVEKAFEGIPIGGLELSCAETIEDFEKKFGELKGFEGLMLHPGKTQFNSSIQKLKNKYPDLKYCVVTLNPKDYKKSDPNFKEKYIDPTGVTIIPAYKWRDILDFFGYFKQE